ncbi:MAG TPA: hypothetical protein VK081_11680, partial [Planctomycetota bacterium]|nr:hypothetical protein [Planctomycetota bacterium]
VKAAWRDFASEIASPLVSPDGGGILIDLGNQAADLMRAFQDLPGPVKAGTTALVGFSGVASLVGGAFLLALPRIIETRAALAQLATDMPRTAAAAGKVGTALKGIGIAAAGFTALSVAFAGLDALNRKIDETLPGLESLAGQLIDMASVPKGFSAAGLAQEFDSLAESVARIVDGRWDDGISAFFDALLPGDTRARSLREATAEVELLDKALADIALQEGPAAAAAALESLVEQGYLTRAQLELMLPLLKNYDDALASVERTTKKSADAHRDEAEAIQDALDAMRAKRSEAIRAVNAEVNYRAAIDDARKALEDNGATLDLNTEAGRDNMRALTDLAASWNDLSDRQKNAQGSAREARQRFIEMATSMGMSEEKARKLARRLLEIKPRNVSVTVNTASASAQLESFIRSSSGRMISIGTRVIADTQGRGAVARASGGPIFGPGSETSDSILARLSNNEHVLSAREVRGLGGHGVVEELRAAARSAPGFANGGTLDRAARRAFDLGGGMSARDVRREFAESRKALGGNTRALEVAQKHSERLAKAWNRLDKRVERREARLDSLRADRDSLVSAAAGSFDNDIFGQGVAGLRLQLEADRNDAQAMRRALAGTQGLGKGLMAALAASGDLATAQELAGMSRAEVRQLSRLYNQRGNAQASLGTYAGDAVYAKQIRRQEATLDRLDGTMKSLARRLNSWERAAERMPNATAR